MSRHFVRLATSAVVALTFTLASVSGASPTLADGASPPAAAAAKDAAPKAAEGSKGVFKSVLGARVGNA